MTDDFKPAWLTDDRAEEVAQRFLERHPRYAAVPVDIDGIVQFDLRMDIIPIPGLKSMSKRLGLNIDAFVSSDFRSITVDQFIMMERVTRYRFSLAHEIGHTVLHQKAYETFQFDSSLEWMTLVAEIPQDKWHPFEYQANEFAGRLLVPRNELLQRYPDAEEQAEIQVLEEFPDLDMDYPYLYEDRLRSTTTELLAQEFHVSPSAMETRLSKEGLIVLGRNNRS